MDFLRRARNPWGEEVLVGLGWDLFWVVVFLGALFILGHAILARKKKGEEASPSVDPEQAAGIPEKVTRHNGSARTSHWVLAIATLTLLITGFVPILGLQFPWVTIHWIAGIVLTGYLVYHTVDTIRRGTLGTMWMGGKELQEGMDRLKGFFRKEDASAHPKPGKWGPENIAFHHVTALAGIAVIATGLLMMFRVDTWFWQANPYILGVSDQLWGWVYVLHGLASVGFVGLLMAHIYFAIRPDKWWISRSMFKGWITREEYLAHHDPELWPVGEKTSGKDRRSASTPESTPDPAPATTSDAAGD